MTCGGVGRPASAARASIGRGEGGGLTAEDDGPFESACAGLGGVRSETGGGEGGSDRAETGGGDVTTGALGWAMAGPGFTVAVGFEATALTGAAAAGGTPREGTLGNAGGGGDEPRGRLPAFTLAGAFAVADDGKAPLVGLAPTFGAGAAVAGNPEIAVVPRAAGIDDAGRGTVDAVIGEPAGLAGIAGDRTAINTATPRNPTVTAAMP
jgi:hypothetical protein